MSIGYYHCGFCSLRIHCCEHKCDFVTNGIRIQGERRSSVKSRSQQPTQNTVQYDAFCLLHKRAISGGFGDPSRFREIHRNTQETGSVSGTTKKHRFFRTYDLAGLSKVALRAGLTAMLSKIFT